MAQTLVVVIATCRDAPLLHRTLESLAECRRPSAYSGTLVVENGRQGPARGTSELFARTLQTRYLHVPEANKCRALNAALDTFGDALIVFADDDIRFDPDTLSAYAAAAERCEGGRFFGGPYGVDYEAPPEEWLVPYLPRSAKGWQAEDDPPGGGQTLFVGFNWAAFARDLRRVGGFNERLGPGAGTIASVGDEDDIQRRLLQEGVARQYVAGARVWHFVPRDRCTPEWAIQRRYVSSIAHAVRCHEAGRLRSLWHYRRRAWWRAPVRLALAALTGDRTRRFRARYEASQDRGMLEGYRRTIREHSGQPLPGRVEIHKGSTRGFGA